MQKVFGGDSDDACDVDDDDDDAGDVHKALRIFFSRLILFTLFEFLTCL